MRIAPLVVAALVLVSAAACNTRREPVPREKVGSGSAAPVTPPPPPAPAPPPETNAISRAEFNRWAVRLNMPVYWIADGDGDQQLDPDEVAALLFYPSAGGWTQDGKLTPAFDAAY